MPGFMTFEEYGITDDGLMADLAKAALRRLPLAWMKHGIKGEYNVDVDPVAILRGDGTDLLNLGEAYTAWISVKSISQQIEGTSQKEHEDIEMSWGTGDSAENGAGSTGRKAPGRTKGAKGGSKKDGRGELDVVIEIDASLTQLIKAALDRGDADVKFKVFDSAEVHMCTTAQIDLSAITSGNSPAAGLIKTLAAALLFNIIPYLTIIMKKVTIESINFDLQGDQSDTPAATVKLKFDKVKWVYHVINQSNMNLIDMSTDYDYTKRAKQDDGKISAGVGTVTNPFG